MKRNYKFRIMFSETDTQIQDNSFRINVTSFYVSKRDTNGVVIEIMSSVQIDTELKRKATASF